MYLTNKEILLKANSYITEGNHEEFLACCTEDIIWQFIGDKTLTGKDAVREYMKTAYVEPPRFDVEKLISEDDYVSAVGKISLKDKNGRVIEYAYCDIWHFRGGKMAMLKAFVIEIK
ncbi:MAG: nuclear transport factor 2 family protein [Sphingobacteriaceae bacterium]|nr:MAG: nuclear transport factor 2 family protein [Sphingobacteriaceae bacterium]